MIQLSLRRALSRATAPSWREASISLQQPAVRIQWHRPRFEHHQSYEARVPPSIFQVSFWRSLIPKPFRRAEQQDTSRDPAARKEWNPATFFIFAFLLVGSMSIQMISLNKDFDAFMRRADVRIGKLREVIEKIQRGEKVDVEKALGTGDAEREAEWEEVLREIEKDNSIRQPTERKRPDVKGPDSPGSSQGATRPKASRADFF